MYLFIKMFMLKICSGKLRLNRKDEIWGLENTVSVKKREKMS